MEERDWKDLGRRAAEIAKDKEFQRKEARKDAEKEAAQEAKKRAKEEMEARRQEERLTEQRAREEEKAWKEAERLSRQQAEKEKKEAEERAKHQRQAEKEAAKLARKKEIERAKRREKARIEARQRARAEVKRQSELARQQNKARKETERLAGKESPEVAGAPVRVEIKFPVEAELRRAAEDAMRGSGDGVEPMVEAGEAGEIGKPVTPVADRSLKGIVKIVIAPPVSTAKLQEMQRHLNAIDNLRVVMVGGSSEAGAQLAVSASEPLKLASAIRELPLVAEAVEDEDGIMVTLASG